MPICPRCGARSQRLGEVCINDGARFIRDDAWAASRHDPLLGRCLIDRFVLVDALGSGTMGTVYDAIQEPIGRRCAVKVLRRELANNARLHRRFKREAEVISRLSHQNLVTLYDFDVDDEGLSFIAMEFVEGRTLDAFQPYDNFSPRLTFHIVVQLISALAEAHRHHVVHRDLKPENVFVCSRRDNPYHLKVLDFGLAKLLESDEQSVLTATGEIFGTPLYMSPEQATGASEICKATDIYALGVMIYELIGGHPPFKAPTPLATMMQHVNLQPPPLSPREGLTLSPAMAAFVARCLLKEPEARFDDARMALDALMQTPELVALSAPVAPVASNLSDRRIAALPEGTSAPPYVPPAPTAVLTPEAQVDPASAPSWQAQVSSPTTALPAMEEVLPATPPPTSIQSKTMLVTPRIARRGMPSLRPGARRPAGASRDTIPGEVTRDDTNAAASAKTVAGLDLPLRADEDADAHFAPGDTIPSMPAVPMPSRGED